MKHALVIALLSLTCAAQVLQDHTHDDQPPPPSNQSRINSKPKKRGPRAIAVVEFLPGGGARLVPVALWIDDRFYDASLYGSNPAPMAIEPETVYEATTYGEPTGLFTVTTPREENGNWIADGHWKAEMPFDEKMAQQAAKQPPKKQVVVNSDDDRPVLRRPGSGGSNSGSSGGTNGTSGASQGTTSSGGSNSSGNAPSGSDDNDPDRPTLKSSSPSSSSGSSQPATSSQPASSSQPTSSAPSQQSSRPTLGGSTAQTNSSAGSQSASNGPSSDEDDPNRPVLRRGKQQMSSDELQPDTTASGKPASASTATPTPAEQAQSKLMATMASLGRRSYPAVSDAGSYETRSLMYAMNSAERQEKSQQMIALAMEDIQKFVSQRKSPALPKGTTITDYDLRAYDLDYSNSPTLVLDATLAVPGAKAPRTGDFQYYVTVVAREDINGQPIKIFSSVTDSNHLDAFRRMEIIDAVDADANGRGDLLFREHSDVGISYSLYRVFPYQMQRVFEGGSGL
ncbi:MAG: hypothetical protein WA655_16330 [Candidatus Korobacteraceae bacterium]